MIKNKIIAHTIDSSSRGKNNKPYPLETQWIASGIDSEVYRDGETIVKVYAWRTIEELLLYKDATDRIKNILEGEDDHITLNGGKYRIIYKVNPIDNVYTGSRGDVISRSAYVEGINIGVITFNGEDLALAVTELNEPQGRVIKTLSDDKNQILRTIELLLQEKTTIAEKRTGFKGIHLSCFQNVKLSFSHDNSTIYFTITDISSSVESLKEPKTNFK